MGILTVGLLGVAALFPVGGFYMQKAEIADRGSAIAQAVMSDIVARGMLNPGAWFVMVPPSGYLTASTTFPSDGKFAPTPPFPQIERGTYTRPFSSTLSESIDRSMTQTGPVDPALVSKQFGSALVIDPLGIAAMAYPDMSPPSDQTWNIASAVFPASAPLTFPSASYPATWGSWGYMWPVRRATFRQPDTGWQMNATTAEHYFRGNDELATDLPDRDDRPAKQNWDIVTSGSSQLPLTRQWVGNYSWLVTVVPSTNAARNGLARNPEGHTYDVSVVVFYKRVLPAGARAVANTSTGKNDFLKTMGRSERAVKAQILSTGLNGGEILLEAMNDQIAGSPFENLKTGQWIMLCGPHPNTVQNDPDPRFVLDWYQVLSIEGRDTRLNNAGTQTPAPPAGDPERRVVAVRGPQWPWQPDDYVAEDLCVAIFNGAVAVHTKTMRLESPKSSSVKFGSGGNHVTFQPPWEFE